MPHTPDGLDMTFDANGNMIFTATDALREELRQQVEYNQELIEQAVDELRYRETYYNDISPRYVSEQRSHVEYLNQQWRDDNMFLELIEHWLCNGYNLIEPEDIGALTESLLISDTTFDSETTQDEANAAKVWYYNWYMTRSYLEDLIETGRMVWTLHKE